MSESEETVYHYSVPDSEATVEIIKTFDDNKNSILLVNIEDVVNALKLGWGEDIRDQLLKVKELSLVQRVDKGTNLYTTKIAVLGFQFSNFSGSSFSTITPIISGLVAELTRLSLPEVKPLSDTSKKAAQNDLRALMSDYLMGKNLDPDKTKKENYCVKTGEHKTKKQITAESKRLKAAAAKLKKK